MRRIVLAADGSDSAFEAALYVIRFVREHGAVEVHVVNVQPRPLHWQTHGMEQETIDEHLALAAHVALKPILHALNEAGVTCETHVEFGDAAETVARLADELGCDHVVMGTRGLGGISGIMLGSVTRKVLHLANVPVTCVRSRKPGSA